MPNNDAVIEFLLNQLRQQLTNNPYKQQCEDLVLEMLSLDTQLHDALAQVAELQETIKLMNEDFKRTTAHPEYREELSQHYKDMMGGTLPKDEYYVVGEHGPEQSGCRKDDTQECEHEWLIMPGLFLSEGNPDNVPGSEFCVKCGKREWGVAGYKPKEDTQECYHNWRFVGGKSPAVCINCGVTKPEECEHEWVEFHGLVIAPCDPRNEPGYLFCRKCGLKEYASKCKHEWSYVMGDGPGVYECDVCGAQSKTLPYDLWWLS